MSWGFFADLRLRLPAQAWQELARRRLADVELADGWSGLEDPELERALGRASAVGDTIEDALSAPAYRTPETIHRIGTRGKITTVRVCLLLDKSLLELAFPLAAALHVARGTAAEGSLRLVNDGTYAGEAGAELRLAEGTITATRLDDDPGIAEELGAELLGGSSQKTTTVRPSARAKPIGRNPFTGEPVYAAPRRPRRS